MFPTGVEALEFMFCVVNGLYTGGKGAARIGGDLKEHSQKLHYRGFGF